MSKIKKFFWSDSDGYSSKDHIMLIFTTTYLVFIITAFIFAILDWETSALLTIVESMDNVIVVIVSGTFGLQAVEKFREKREDRKEESEPTI